jgi:hypothetical protein
MEPCMTCLPLCSPTNKQHVMMVHAANCLELVGRPRAFCLRGSQVTPCPLRGRMGAWPAAESDGGAGPPGKLPPYPQPPAYVAARGRRVLSALREQRAVASVPPDMRARGRPPPTCRLHPTWSPCRSGGGSRIRRAHALWRAIFPGFRLAGRRPPPSILEMYATSILLRVLEKNIVVRTGYRSQR